MTKTETENILLFPTPIGRIINFDLAQKVLPYAEHTLNDPKNLSSVLTYTSTYTRTPPPSSILDELNTYIKEVSNKFLVNIGILEECLGLDIFFSKMNSGDFHELHTHSNSVLAGVFYLQVPHNSSNITFCDPRKHSDIIRYESDVNNPLCWDSFGIPPSPGLLLIWPSWLPHRVSKNNSNNRITCVFNIYKKN